MKKMRKKYVVPLVTKHIVELEEGMCATGSIMSDAKSGVKASAHTTGIDETYNIEDPNSSSFEVGEWN